MSESMRYFLATIFIRAFAFIKIPLLGAIKPKVVEMTPQRLAIKVPLNRRNKNHLGVMYFGALAMGGEAAVGIKAVDSIRTMKAPVDFLFKDFNARFLKRAEGDVVFVCEQGEEIEALVKKCIESKQRENATFRSFAIVPSISPTEHVAEFDVTLSVKARMRKARP